jgi:hypothetical protein
MLPISLLAPQKFSELLINGSALNREIESIALAAGTTIPGILSSQIGLSSAHGDLADRDVQATYPRVSIYSSAVQNSQIEKFRSLSGTVVLKADVWTSGNLVTDIDRWIHFYVEGITNVLRRHVGDWGDGLFFPGMYDVQFQLPKLGGLGFVQAATLSSDLRVSCP